MSCARVFYIYIVYVIAHTEIERERDSVAGWTGFGMFCISYRNASGLACRTSNMFLKEQHFVMRYVRRVVCTCVCVHDDAMCVDYVCPKSYFVSGDCVFFSLSRVAANYVV